MSRPSRNQDQLLIETAKRLYPEVGASGMSLKRIADEAGVNLGMFSYYFGSKSNFIRKVLEALAEESRVDNAIPLPASAPSIERLRCFLLTMSHSYRDHRRLALAMYRDFLNQDPDVTEHLLDRVLLQTTELTPLIEECQRDGYVDDTLAVQQIIGFCMGTVKTPIVVAASQEREPDQGPQLLQEGVTRMLTDESIAQRVELALRAIAKPGPARR
ncbi:MAG: TetR/AcrR family transcriptional regulator [Edaphobacter sp.]|uniref:TetR/AcrR family transcriptional regulator n=1 Tax=Edaphobacter sp. TaxID=1934404 RepID=UPI00238B2F46|nr:TetR/AcrR family transcriptional regulator [Edaphobacter sp.]MDE1178774.1 TetR/AcrR family transcriptional regulator [Edaphobacter sp.]